MSKGATIKSYEEALRLIKQFRRNDHLLAMAMVQLTEREKVKVLNRYRAAHNEPLLPPEPPRLPGDRGFEWVVDVPREWVSQTGRNFQ